MVVRCWLCTKQLLPAIIEMWTLKMSGVYIVYIYILWCQEFGQEFLSRPKYAIRGTGINSRSKIASFERRLRGAAPTPLALPCPFRTST